MSSSYVLLLTFLLLGLTNSYPSPNANLTARDDDDDIHVDYYLSGFTDCKKRGYDVNKIKNGFREMITLIGRDEDLPIPIDHYPPIDWKSGSAMDYWGPWERSNDWRTHIKENLDRAAVITEQSWWNLWKTTLKVRCDDPLDQCTCDPKKGKVIAYVIEHKPEINFCPEYFNLRSLEDAMNRVPDLPQIWWHRGHVKFYYNRAVSWAHEVMHIKEIGHPSASNLEGIGDQLVLGYPGVGGGGEPERAYGSVFTKWLAQYEGNLPSDPVDNADNYALFILANYVERKKGHYPSGMQVQLTPRRDGQQGQVIEATGLDFDGDHDYEHYCYSKDRGDPTTNAPKPQPEGICSGNIYRDQTECENRCKDGQCTESTDPAGVKCTCPAPEEPENQECTNGSYDDMDKCSEKCYQGSCNMSGGVEGVECVCP